MRASTALTVLQRAPSARAIARSDSWFRARHALVHERFARAPGRRHAAGSWASTVAAARHPYGAPLDVFGADHRAALLVRRAAIHVALHQLTQHRRSSDASNCVTWLMLARSDAIASKRSLTLTYELGTRLNPSGTPVNGSQPQE